MNLLILIPINLALNIFNLSFIIWCWLWPKYINHLMIKTNTMVSYNNHHISNHIKKHSLLLTKKSVLNLNSKLYSNSSFSLNNNINFKSPIIIINSNNKKIISPYLRNNLSFNNNKSFKINKFKINLLNNSLSCIIN